MTSRWAGGITTAAMLLGLLAGMVVGCEPGRTVVPPGAQEVHVVVTGSEVRLDPATARAGDIYLVLDTPRSSVMFIERKSTAEETPGPLSDDNLARLVHGDTQGTSISGISDGEPHGNVYKMVLSAGRYLFMTDNPEALAGRSGGVVPAGSIAILEIVP